MRRWRILLSYLLVLFDHSGSTSIVSDTPLLDSVPIKHRTVKVGTDVALPCNSSDFDNADNEEDSTNGRIWSWKWKSQVSL